MRVADLLHADTQRATNLETTRQRIADMQEALKHLDEQRQSLVTKRQSLAQRWDALVSPLRRPELTPAALREWLSRRDRVAEKNGDLESLRREREAVAKDLAGARSQLDQALRACGMAGCVGDETAASALARAQKAVSVARKARADRDSLLEQVKTAEAELRGIQAQRAQVTGKLTEWRSSWSRVAESLKLSGDALPAESKARLDQLTRLSDALNDLAELDREVGTHGTIATEFESRVADLANAVEEIANGRTHDTVTETLYVALGDTRKAEASRQQIVNDVQRESGVLAQADASALQAGKQLDELLQQGACASLDDLPDVEVKAARKQLLQQRLVELDEQLVKQNARPINEVKLESEGFDLDSLGRQLDDVAAQIEDLEGQVDTAQTARFTAKQNFDAIDGGPTAADAQQALMALSARIVKEARSYARVRLAGAVLSRVVQAYRDRHQGPILQRAAQVFARITLASFSGLTVDYDDDRQVLLGVRPDSSRVPVAGMSQGTRDQLFLSLRIAAIEQHVEGRGPMPVIVDDLLVQFDDDRAVEIGRAHV